MIPYLLLADIANTALAAFFIFSDQVLYPSYKSVQVFGMSAHDDQALAGAIMWVPGSIAYLLPAIVLAVGLFSPQGRMMRPGPPVIAVKRRSSPDLRGTALHMRRLAQVLMLVIAIAVMADGFFGPQITPINLAGVLPWIHWRALSLLALIAVGNLFCFSCPFTLVRDMARRIFPPQLRWPRQLRSKWLPVVLLILFLWAYEAFGLWDSPWLTAWIIAGYFASALVIDSVFRGASFCKYVCPIGQFHFVASLLSPHEVRVRSLEVCQSCRTHDCIRGNEHARGCELYLFQPKKVSNLDCTFCLDCVKACPHDNVALLPVLPAQTLLGDPYRSGIGRLSRRTDIAVLALVVVFGAFVNAAGMAGPVMAWEHGLHARMGVHAMPFIVAAFSLAGLVVVPLFAVLVCGALNRLWGATLPQMRRFVYALVPVGISMWCAHLLYHFATSWSSAIPAINRAATGSITAFSTPMIPGWLPPMQIVLLDLGLLATLYLCWRLAAQFGGKWKLSAPWAALSCSLYAGGVWILLQPMAMRGMLH